MPAESSYNGDQGAAASLLALILPKLHEARRISEEARWGLLDVVVWLNEIEDDIVRGSKAGLRAALDDLDLTGLTTNRADSAAREYQPENDPDWRCQ